jgi:hypothetical protein
MRHFIAALGLVLIASMFPQSSRAQMNVALLSGIPLTAAQSNAWFDPDQERCSYFQNTRFNRARIKDEIAMQAVTTLFTQLDHCIDGLDANFPTAADINTSVSQALAQVEDLYNISSSDQVDETLITLHFFYRILTHWASLDKQGEADQFVILASLDERLHRIMEYVGLLDPFAGELVGGPVIGQTGKLSSGTTAASGSSTTTSPSTTTGTNTNALVHIEWASQHFFAEKSSPVDMGFGGSLGLQPALSLLVAPPPSAGATPASSSVTPQYQSAFVWDLNLNTNLHAGSNAETSAIVRAGQVRLLSGNGATIVNQGSTGTLEIPLNGNANSMSWFYEAGVEFNYYMKVLEVIHAEKGQLDPAFNIGISYKKDTRFSQNAGVVGFTSPDERLVVKFLINGLKIFDRRPNTTVSKPYTISFGVNYERGFGSNPVPSGTSIIIKGDVDLLKLINPGSGGQ